MTFKEYFSQGSRYLDQNGKPVSRTRDKYPYSYDPDVIIRKGDYADVKGTAYSDRMLQWDWDKSERLKKKHFGDTRQNWSNRSAEKIEAYLRDYFDNPDIKLIMVMEDANHANGYPYWVFLWGSVNELQNKT